MRLLAFVLVAAIGATAAPWLFVGGAGGWAPRAQRARAPSGAREVPCSATGSHAAEGGGELPAVQGEEAPITPPDTGDAFVVTGSLVDEAGCPVPLARLSNMHRKPNGFHVWSRGAAVGGAFRFEFTGLPPAEKGEVLFFVEAPGYVSRAVEGSEQEWETLRRGGPLSGLRVALRRAAVVEGVVLSPDGSPAQGADVGWVDDPFDRIPVPGLSTVTDEEGRFILDQLDPERGGYLIARGENALSAPAPLGGRLAGGRVVWQELRLEALSNVTLTLELAGGPAGLEVWTDYPFREEPSGSELLVETLSGAHAYELRDPAEPSWRQRIEFTIPHGVTEHGVRVEVLTRGADR
jgi:hypothetical protein